MPPPLGTFPIWPEILFLGPDKAKAKVHSDMAPEGQMFVWEKKKDVAKN
jgi:hypothetical protein